MTNKKRGGRAMINRFRTSLCALTLTQRAVCLAAFVVSLCLALALVWLFTRWNGRLT